MKFRDINQSPVASAQWPEWVQSPVQHPPLVAPVAAVRRAADPCVVPDVLWSPACVVPAKVLLMLLLSSTVRYNLGHRSLLCLKSNTLTSRAKRAHLESTREGPMHQLHCTNHMLEPSHPAGTGGRCGQPFGEPVASSHCSYVCVVLLGS